MREFDWIARYFVPLTQGRADALGLNDDAAILNPPAGKLVVTTDSLNESVHFLANTPPRFIAHKALATNLSDLAAMGAVPYAYTLALSLPPHTDEAWIAEFCAGLAALQQAYRCFLLGGDTTRSSGPLSVTITAFGIAENPLLRSGARVGDALYVTGTIGDARCGLHLCNGGTMNHCAPADRRRRDDESYLLERYHLPTPRLTVGKALDGIATACMDISDGLLQDAAHIARASGVGLHMDAESIPISPAAREYMRHGNLTPLDLFAGGDDYELLFTAPPDAADSIARIAAATGVAITRIGAAVQGSGVTLLDAAGRSIEAAQTGWQHF